MKKQLYIVFIFLCLAVSAFSQTPITSTIPYQGYDETQGYLGEAEYQIFMDTSTNVFDKPIILVDGFDPGDNRNLAQMYALLDNNGSNVADQLRSEGFDFVLLNFPVYTRASDNVVVDGGSDYIQRNAMILTELINQINTQKTGAEELVVIGPSMGGLISRYALKYMEDNSLAHETRLFISWDSPHKGANLPISMQYLMNYVAESTSNQDIIDNIAATLGSPASKQMMIDNYAAHLQSGSAYEQDATILLPAGAVNFRDAFQGELDTMGFPLQVRNICVANGSGNNTMIGTPGMEVLNGTFDVPDVANTTAEIVLHFTPLANQTIEVTSSITRYFGFQIASFSADAESFSFTDGVDSAPGGKYNIQSFVGGANGNQLITDLLNALQQSEFCFIPTLSSLAITNEDDWYAVPDIGNSHTSPFDAWYVPTTNEDHVTATNDNVAFILPEIRNQVSGINDVLLSEKYKLKSNLVNDNLTVIIDNKYNYNNVKFQIYNISGQRLQEKRFNHLNNNVSLPIQLNYGVYFVEFTDDSGRYIQKFVVGN